MASKWMGGKEGGSSEWSGFMDKTVSIEGKIVVTGTFRVDGEVKGHISSEQGLVLGDNAKVEGEINAKDVTIAGRFDGQIFAKEKVEIQPKGIVTGEVHTPCMIIQPGGILDGKCHMLTAAEEQKSITIPIRSGPPSG